MRWRRSTRRDAAVRVDAQQHVGIEIGSSSRACRAAAAGIMCSSTGTPPSAPPRPRMPPRCSRPCACRSPTGTSSTRTRRGSQRAMPWRRGAAAGSRVDERRRGSPGALRHGRRAHAGQRRGHQAPARRRERVGLRPRGRHGQRSRRPGRTTASARPTSHSWPAQRRSSRSSCAAPAGRVSPQATRRRRSGAAARRRLSARLCHAAAGRRAARACARSRSARRRSAARRARRARRPRRSCRGSPRSRRARPAREAALVEVGRAPSRRAASRDVGRRRRGTCRSGSRSRARSTGRTPMPSRTHRSASAPSYSSRMHEVVVRLQRDVRGQARSPRATASASREARRAVVGRARCARTLPSAISSPKAPSVSSSGVAVVVDVGVVEVDAVGAEARERGLGGACGSSPARGPSRPGSLPTFVATTISSRLPRARHPVADDRLGLAAAVARRPGRVGVGRVDEVAAGRGVGVEHGERLRLVDRPAEDVAAEAEREDRRVRVAERCARIATARRSAGVARLDRDLALARRGRLHARVRSSAAPMRRGGDREQRADARTRGGSRRSAPRAWLSPLGGQRVACATPRGSRARPGRARRPS